MLAYKVELDFSKFRKMTEEMIERSENLEPQMQGGIGGDMLKEVQLNFRDEHDPEGNKWIPSQRVLKKGGKTLSKTGMLKKSISVQSDNQAAAVGTNLEYAALHQFGTQGLEGGGIYRSSMSREVAWRKKKGTNQRRFTKKTSKTSKARIYRITVRAYGIQVPARRYIGITPYKARIYSKSILNYIIKGKVNMPRK